MTDIITTVFAGTIGLAVFFALCAFSPALMVALVAIVTIALFIAIFI